MSHSVQMTRAWAPSHASYGSLEMVTSLDTTKTETMPEREMGNKASEVMHITQVLQKECLTEVNGGEPGAPPNFLHKYFLGLSGLYEIPLGYIHP